MSRLFLILLISCLGVWLVGGSWWYANKFGVPVKNIAQPSVLPVLNVMDGDFKITNQSNFHFRHSSDKIVVPWETEKGLKSLVKYLDKHSNRNVVLTGNYSPSEHNRTRYLDLGFARADAVRNLLISYGAKKKDIIIQSMVREDLKFNRNLLFDGLTFSFEKKNVPFSEVSLEKEVITATRTVEKIRPLNLYYDNNTDFVNNSPQLKNYLSNLDLYLNSHPDSKVLLVGHTDNVGASTQNEQLSKKRAFSVKTLMENFGIATQRIMIEYQGDKKPLASNATVNGRKKNRRVEVRIVR